MKLKWKWILSLALVLALFGAAFLLSSNFRRIIISKGYSTQTKGFSVANKQGCFQCHGFLGQGGVPNPGVKSIPGFQDFAFLMSVRSEAELEEWILKGAPTRLTKQAGFEKSKKNRAITMPAFAEHLNKSELQDLKTFYMYVSGIVYPKDKLADKGFKLARDHGCFSCHGYGGVVDMDNAGSLVGKIPSWSGPDFPELAQNTSEIKEWIHKGGPDRLVQNPFARYFMDRQVLKMPAYENFLTEEEIDAIVSYIQWLRDDAAPGKEPDYQGDDSSFDLFQYE